METTSQRLAINALNHESTPPELAALNQRLVDLINASETDANSLLACVEERDSLITDWLAQLPEQDKKQFAIRESEVNNNLTCVCKDLMNAVEKDLLKVKRGRKAVKSYTK